MTEVLLVDFNWWMRLIRSIIANNNIQRVSDMMRERRRSMVKNIFVWNDEYYINSSKLSSQMVHRHVLIIIWKIVFIIKYLYICILFYHSSYLFTQLDWLIARLKEKEFDVNSFENN